MTRILFPAALAAALAVTAVGDAVRPAAAEDAARIAANPAPDDDMATGSARLAAGDPASRFVALGVGKSIVIDLSREVRDVLVSNPKIANAVIRSPRRAYLIGVDVGQTNIYFFDGEGRQIAGFDIAVTRDLNGVRAALKQILPNADVHIEGVGDGVVLSGSVPSAVDSQRANDLAVRLVGGDPTKVVNSLMIAGRDQVMLKVTVAEIQRNVIKQLGINISGSMGNASFVPVIQNPFSASGTPISNTAIGVGKLVGASVPSLGFNSLNATLQAMEQAGAVRTLAEPTLTAVSGENATFLAGGEFPVPAGYTCSTAPPFTCQLGIAFKQFGVSLGFTPIVLSEGRISLKILTEVSDLSNENTLTLAQGTGSVIIPSIQVRRSETTVEVPSGGALAMAGMIKDQTKQAVNGVPALMDLPVLGTLFRSREYLNNKTELVVIVTPYIVHPVSPKDLSRPTDGFVEASDPAGILLGKFNRLYGAAEAPDPRRTYYGKPGFILD